MTPLQIDLIAAELSEAAEGEAYHVTVYLSGGNRLTGGWYKRNAGMVRVDVEIVNGAPLPPGHHFTTFVQLDHIAAVGMVTV